MNKSKFLKKSLAAVLAILMIVAMIPLSAAAASTGYKPTGLKITGPNGEVATGSGNSYTLNLNWDKTDPKIVISTETADDKIWAVKSKVDGDGNQVGSEPTVVTGNPTVAISLETEDDGTPIPFRFFVKDGTGNQQSDDITVTWTKASASTSGKATSAKLAGKFDGEINDSAKTITFTVPFGYDMIAAGANAYVINFEGCADSSISGTYTSPAVVGTNMKKPVPAKVSTETQDGKTTVQYDIIVKEETGLTEFKVGDLKTEIEIATAAGTNTTLSKDYDAGMETGNIKVYVPSTLEPVDSKVKLIPSFAISDPNISVTIQNGADADANKDTAESGKEFDFSYAYCGNASATATTQNTTGVALKLVSTGNATRTYQLIFVRNEDVELTSVKAVDGDGAWTSVDGTIDGSDIEIVVPKNAALDDVDLTFTGPRAFTNTASVTVSGKSEVKFTNTGAAVGNVEEIDYTKPLSVVVKSDDGKHQKVYTLTVKAIEEDSVAPAITSGVLVLNKGASDEATYNASISGTTITFTVPHSTTDAEITAGVYTWARNSKATTLYFGTTASPTVTMPDTTTVKKPTTVAEGGSVGIVSASGNAVKYEIKFARAAAETGKSISNMIMTGAAGTYYVGRNNNKTYNVTISNGKFTVTVPSKTATYIESGDASKVNVNFELSKGAKLYQYTKATNDNVTEVQGPDSNGTFQSAIDLTSGDTIGYFVADEMLATMIVNTDKKICDAGTSTVNYAIINREYGSHKADYALDVKESASNETRLPASFTDVQGKVQATVSGLKDNRTITITVPDSYVSESKWFHFDYDMPNGATFGIISNTDAEAKANFNQIFDGGKVTYSTSSKEYTDVDDAWVTNFAFMVSDDGNGNYTLNAGKTGTLDADYYAITNTKAGVTANGRLYVMAEDETTFEFYKVAIKKADAETGAQITNLTVNGTNASIDQNAKTITANVPYGTNLGQIKIALTASKMALVTAPSKTDVYDTEIAGTYDLRYPIKITVKSESTTPRVINTYTLTVKTGEQFTDVPANAWFAPYVKEAFEKGIVNGRGNGLFGPYDNITREDFAVMTGRMLGITVDEDADVPFTDASSVSDYAKGYVAYFAKEGIIGGYEDSTFKPKNNITREEAAKILAVALELEVTGTPTFVDTNKISGWARPYVAAVQTAKIFNGDEANRFNGTTRITRAETAKVMVDSLKIK